MAEVRVENLVKRFEDVVAVNDISLEVKDGEFVVLLGPTGCGKTTTLRCIAGLETPDSGEIYIDGRPVTKLSPAERDIAFVFQTFALYPHMRVYDNIAFPLKAVKLPKEEIDKRVREVAEILRISHLLSRRPGKLSGGEMQRVALGRAMVRRPKVFLMDEPLTSLDAKLRAEMRAELKRLQTDQNATTIYVTHDQLEAMSMGDRIAVMDAGKILQIGTPMDVYNHPENLFVAGFIGTPEMNMIPCEFVGKGDGGEIVAVNGAFTLPLPTSMAQKIMAKATSRDLIFGVRAEDVLVHRTEAPGRIPAEIYIIEPLGSENIVNVLVGPYRIKAKSAPTFYASIGEKVWIEFIMDRTHIFDRNTGLAIR
jgi:multiple sugar transport system ATP-binding protein